MATATATLEEASNSWLWQMEDGSRDPDLFLHLAHVRFDTESVKGGVRQFMFAIALRDRALGFVQDMARSSARQLHFDVQVLPLSSVSIPSSL
jgi:hypothetical protein